MRKWIVIWGMFPLLAFAQPITLTRCKELARKNYPTIQQVGLIKEISAFNMSNAAKGNLPKLSVSAGGYAFTDPLNGSAQMSQLGLDLKKRVAQVAVTLQQNIFDGGEVAVQRKLIQSEEDVKNEELSVSMYEVDERVEQLFFSILTIDEQIRQTDLLNENLQISLKNVKGMLSGGLANECDVDAVRVELLKTEQQKEAFAVSRKAYIRMLSLFIGSAVDEQNPLVRPVVASGGSATLNRPELHYFAAQERLINQQRLALNVRLMPKLLLFATGMVHSSLNERIRNQMLFGGVSLSWNIGALYTRKNDLNKLHTQQMMVDSQRNAFLFNNRLENELSDGNQERLQRMICKDDEIVKLRESILEKSRMKVKMGTESVDEMLRHVNAVSQAHQQKALHEIELLKEICNQKTLNNE